MPFLRIKSLFFICVSAVYLLSAPTSHARSFDDIKCEISRVSNERFSKSRKPKVKSDIFFNRVGREHYNMEPFVKRTKGTDQQPLIDTTLVRPKRATPLPVNIDFSNTAFLFQITADKTTRITLSAPKVSSKKKHDTLVKQGKDGCYILIRRPDAGQWNLAVQSIGNVDVKAGNVTALFIGDVFFKRAIFSATGPMLTNALSRIDHRDFLEVKFTGAQRFITTATKFILKDASGAVLTELPSLYVGYGTYMIAPFESSKTDRWLHIEGIDEFRRPFKRKHHLPIDDDIPPNLFHDVQNIKPNSSSIALNTTATILGNTQIQAYERAWKEIIAQGGTYSNERLLELYKKYSLFR
ncbi:MAG: hypothetical protein MK137_05140 [Rickettsiales bacterium]|nr:hypothetical protein [Rickettsiales bacterium]